MVVTLRQWRLEDASAIVEFMRGGEVVRNLRDGLPDPYAIQDALAYIQGCLNAGDERQLARCIDVDGATAGSIGLFRKDNIYRISAEVGYWLGKPYWGKGVMTQAVQQMCALGFATYADIVRIYAEPFARNVASCRVLEKAGFVREAVLKRNAIKDGEILDTCVYALLRD